MIQNSKNYRYNLLNLHAKACSCSKVQRNGLPRDGPGFDSRWERCIYRASRPCKWGCRL